MEEIGLTDPRWIRAGILPYLEVEGTRYYAIGIDRDYGTLMDFGGNRESFDRDIVETAQREMTEESYGVLGSFSREDLENSFILVDDDYIEFVLPLSADRDSDLRKIIAEFDFLRRFDPNPEHRGMMWIPEATLRLIIESDLKTVRHVIYPRLWKLLRRGGFLEMFKN